MVTAVMGQPQILSLNSLLYHLTGVIRW